jgi:hypothetical protein
MQILQTTGIYTVGRVQSFFLSFYLGPSPPLFRQLEQQQWLSPCLSLSLSAFLLSVLQQCRYMLAYTHYLTADGGGRG